MIGFAFAIGSENASSVAGATEAASGIASATGFGSTTGVAVASGVVVSGVVIDTALSPTVGAVEGVSLGVGFTPARLLSLFI
jgi:hypothetical protein